MSNDLSHYDLLNMFSARQAACLIAGLEPGRYPLGFHPPAKAAVLERAIFEAHDRAMERVRQVFEENPLGISYSRLMSVLYDCDWPAEEKKYDVLPSNQLRQASKQNSSTVGFSFRWPSDKNTLTFERQDIANWLRASGYTGACYFVPEDERPNNTEVAYSRGDTMNGQLPTPEKALTNYQKRERLILSTLDDLGYNPKALPATPGKRGAKAETRDRVEGSALFASKSTFDNCWKELQRTKVIQSVQPGVVKTT